MRVFKLLFWHHTSACVKGTTSKMVSTLPQKWLTIFCRNAQNCVYFVPCDFVQISLACGPNTYQIIKLCTERF